MPSRARRQRDDEKVHRFVDQTAMLMAEWGFPRMPARVLMTMMADDHASLTAADLSERLGVSPAAISGAVRYLIQLGMLVRAPVRGSRRDAYRLPDDPWYAGTAIKGGIYKTLADLADDGVAALGGSATVAGARVAEMRDFFVFIESEMGALLEKWAASRPVSRRPTEQTGSGSPVACP